MRDEYDFSKMKKAPNPYRKKARKQISIRTALRTILDTLRKRMA
jgi:hypothetical protein